MLSQATGYAAMALGYVAAAGGRAVLVKQIAEACEIPAPYLSKIVHTLARAGIVKTQRGIGGGVTLLRDPDTLSLLDLCETLDDPILERRCMLGVAECTDERACPAHEFAMAERQRRTSFLQEKTVADIAEFETPRRWQTIEPTVNGSHRNGSHRNGSHQNGSHQNGAAVG